VTTPSPFKRAVRRQAKLRLAIEGPSGCGKTWTSLCLARGLVGADGRIALIDTERGSASLYGEEHEFDVLELHDNYSPDRYRAALKAAADAGYDVVIVDSLSHAWEAAGGVQEIADRNKKGGNTWAGWATATPAYRGLIDAILQSPLHVVATMRTKSEWAETKDERGKTKYERVGTAPVMRAGVEYEFTLVCDMDLEHNLDVTKSRYSAISGQRFRHPGPELGEQLAAWLAGGAPAEEGPPAEPDLPAVDPVPGTPPASAPAPPAPSEPIDWQVRLLTEAGLPDNPWTRAGSNGVLKAKRIRLYDELASAGKMQIALDGLREKFPTPESALFAEVTVPIASASQPGTKHDVKLRREGAAAKAKCPCKGFEFSHACRHLPLAWGSLALSWLTPDPVSPEEAWQGIDVDALARVARAEDEALEPKGAQAGDPFAKVVRRCISCNEEWTGPGTLCEDCLDANFPDPPVKASAHDEAAADRAFGDEPAPVAS
jgi:AAA domain-containing protein